jgi:hypothetical protein
MRAPREGSFVRVAQTHTRRNGGYVSFEAQKRGTST